jgi:hypothetical protein
VTESVAACDPAGVALAAGVVSPAVGAKLGTVVPDGGEEFDDGDELGDAPHAARSDAAATTAARDRTCISHSLRAPPSREFR